MKYEPIISHLKCDSILANLIDRYGPPRLSQQADAGDLFLRLVDAIISQQISAKAAAKIVEKLKCNLPGACIAPESIQAAGIDGLRSSGLSGQKARYVAGLAEQVLTGGLRLDILIDMDDEAVIEHLVKLKGIGRWTAQMFLIFALSRPDVLPVDDLGFRTALQRQYALPSLPGAVEIEQLAQLWRPYRTYAAWYLWRSLENTPRE
ncbi:MAG: DNA-3-methyladenine glycosylase 2 family protein [Chloroflexi bacterium]|nr:DNA-3-methyladenine glycosylase 2 family protein [Chloroflexota bacterium]